MFARLKPLQVSVDVAIALVFFLLAVGTSSGRSDYQLVAVALAVALGLRRFSPGVALAIAWASALAQMYLFRLNPGFLDLAIIAVVYVTAAYGGRRVRWIGFASIFVGGVLGAIYLGFESQSYIVALRFDFSSVAAIVRLALQFGFYFVLLLVLLGLPWTGGNLVRTRVLARESREAQALAELEAAKSEADVIVEQERNRIARDMHDVVAHSLAVVIAQADGARYASAADPGAAEAALTTISSTAREALGDVRLLLGQLRHSQSEGPQPALADLDRLLDQLRASGLVIAFEARGVPLALGTGQQLAVYRIVQEALTNALRHGDIAAEVTVTFEWTETDLEVTISSRIPASPKTAELRAGHGLAGMRERAVLVGGTFHTETAGRFFVVRATIPGTAAVAS